MGTRSLTYVYVEDTPIMCMYRQFDGYPSGHGVELAEFLTQIEMGDGMAGKPELFSFANGMGCLAAQMIVNFKKSPGGFYIYPVELDQACWQEYEYHVYDGIVIVKNPTEVIFEGSYDEFMSFCYDKVTE
jgi:hypothetical protein